jgi:hypothetical protein
LNDLIIVMAFQPSQSVVRIDHQNLFFAFHGLLRVQTNSDSCLL